MLGTLLWVAMSAFPAHAQTAATINGRITDPQGLVVPGAEIRAVNINTNVAYATKSNDVGLYSIPNVPVGTYRVIVQKQGFMQIVKPDVQLHVQDIAELNFSLQVGSVTQSVTVEGGAPVVNTESAAVGTVVDRNFVENMPLNGRSFQSLITMVPGVTLAANASVGSQGEFSINGQRPDANYFTVDGVAANTGVNPNTNVGIQYGGQYAGETAIGTTQSLVSVDALEEFRINTSTYSAEFGHTAGGQISLQTRPGTNQWHGSAFDYFRNDVLDANSWFNNVAGIPKTAERQNDFGGTLGGPVVIPGLYNGKDKTFFFFSYEGLRLRVPQSAITLWVPDTTLRQTAPAALRPVLNAFPVPNGPEQTNNFALYTGAYSEPSTLDAYSFRVDQAVGQNWRLFGRYAYTPSSNLTRGTTSSLSELMALAFNTKVLTFGATAALSPRLSNDVRFNTTWQEPTYSLSTDNFGGATPAPLQQVFTIPAEPYYQASVGFHFGTRPGLQWYSYQTSQRQWNVNDTLSAVLGSHILKFGFDYRRLATPILDSRLFTFYTFYDQSHILSNTAGFIYALTKGSTPPAELDVSNYSAFVQDEWKIRRRLHLSLGLRWDVDPPPGNGNGPLPRTLDQVTNLATAKLAPQGTPLWNTYYRGFAPRLGVAYELRESGGYQTVLRGGFGIFYDMGIADALGGADNGVGFMATSVFSNSAFPLTPQQLAALPSPSTASPYNSAVTAYNPNRVLPKVYQWNVSLEQGLGGNQALTMSYVGAAGRDLLAERYYDLSSVNPNFSLGNGLWLTTNSAESDYDALQVQFQRRLSHRLQVLASYTWAHSIDNLSGSIDYSSPLLRGNSDFDVRHTFSAAVTYNLPGQYSNKLAQAALGHWSLDTRIMGRSALPFTVESGSTYLGGTQWANLIPNVNPGVPIYLSAPTAPGGRVVNLAAFSAPSSGQGNEPRNFLRGFDLWQTDLALRKDFPLHERLKLQFRAEAFNLFNRPNFGAIDNSTTDGPALFGKATGLLNTQLGGLNALHQMGGPRSIQLALKLIF
jgi:hypothetical protein